MFNFIGSVMKAMLASSRYYYKIMFVLIFWIHFHLSVYHFSSLWALSVFHVSQIKTLVYLLNINIQW